MTGNVAVRMPGGGSMVEVADVVQPTAEDIEEYEKYKCK
jgi:hypothetical protein